MKAAICKLPPLPVSRKKNFLAICGKGVNLRACAKRASKRPLDVGGLGFLHHDKCTHFGACAAQGSRQPLDVSGLGFLNHDKGIHLGGCVTQGSRRPSASCRSHVRRPTRREAPGEPACCAAASPRSSWSTGFRSPASSMKVQVCRGLQGQHGLWVRNPRFCHPTSC